MLWRVFKCDTKRSAKNLARDFRVRTCFCSHEDEMCIASSGVAGKTKFVASSDMGLCSSDYASFIFVCCSHIYNRI